MFKHLEQFHYTIIGCVLAALNLIVFTWLYLASPFDELVSRAILDAQTVVAAGLATVFLFLITRKFEPGEPPRVLWMAFALGIACWTVGEIIWAAENILADEVGLGLADFFWALGYPLLSVAMLRQYQLIFPHKVSFLRLITIILWVVVLGLTGLVLVLTNTGMDSFLGVFYPFGDFALGILALNLIITFKRGRLAYPWISLLVFVVSDSLFIWADSQELYHYVLDGDPFSYFIDLTYLIAYLAMGWGVVQQYLLLHFGAKEINSD